jgi:hypothetical protein
MWFGGIAMDVLLGAGPWVLGVAICAAGLTAIYTEVSGSDDTFALFNAPIAINAISTFASFLLVGKQSANLANNAKIIGEFGNLSGSLVNVCLFLKSQISSGKSVEFITLSDGKGGFFQTTRIGLVCASIMYVVKYTGRGTTIVPAGLPLGQDARLLASYTKYIAPANGAPGMSPFLACILMVGELVDEFQMGEKASEYAVLFGQINAVTGAEGAIGGTAGYSQPYIMKYLLYILYSLYLFLLLITDLVPNNRWNSVWISAVLAFCTVSFYQISERYGKTATPHTPVTLRTTPLLTHPTLSQLCARKPHGSPVSHDGPEALRLHRVRRHGDRDNYGLFARQVHADRSRWRPPSAYWHAVQHCLNRAAKGRGMGGVRAIPSHRKWHLTTWK